MFSSIRQFYLHLVRYGPKTFVKFLHGEITMVTTGFFNQSFSQHEEDVLIDKLLGNKKTGFYVDVGAYHPTRLSNTKRFYLKGWRGINIEPNPQKIKNFYRLRPDDTNLNIGIANKNGKLKYFEFEPDTLSTFSRQAAEDYKRQGFNLMGISRIDVLKLSSLFSKYCRNKQIDFMSVDVEGYDYEVLKSNDWKKFKPTVVCVEANPITDVSTEKLLAGAGYKKVCKNHNNLIFLKK